MHAKDKLTAAENFKCWCFIVQEKNLGGGGGVGHPLPPLVRPRVNKQQVTVVVLPAFCAAHPKNENI